MCWTCAEDESAGYTGAGQGRWRIWITVRMDGRFAFKQGMRSLVVIETGRRWGGVRREDDLVH